MRQAGFGVLNRVILMKDFITEALNDFSMKSRCSRYLIMKSKTKGLRNHRDPKLTPE